MKFIQFTIILTLCCINISIGQSYKSPLFEKCNLTDPSEVDKCNKKEMLQFIQQEILTQYGDVKKSDVMNDIILSFDVKKDGSVSNVSLMEKTQSRMFVTSAVLNIGVKNIPSFTGNEGQSIRYLYPRTPTESQDENLITISPLQVEIFKVVEKMPKFPGCESDNNFSGCTTKKLAKYIDNNLVYPKEAIDNKIEGTVVVDFIVTEEGLIKDVKIRKDIGFGCGKAAIDVIESMNNMSERWTPGAQRTRIVSVLITKPIEFKLNKNHKNKD
jgi:TonB family protein